VRARLLGPAPGAGQRPRSFSVLDLGCGDSQVLVDALEAAGGIWERCAAYTGVDMSAPALALGARNLGRVLPPGAALRQEIEDMRSFMVGCPPASVDLAFASFSVHHLEDGDKAALLAGLRRALRPGGVALIVDVFRADDGSQSRAAYMEAYLPQIRSWAGLSPAAVENVTHHVATYDQPTTVPFYREAAAAAGFSSVRVLESVEFYRTLALEV
jgi:SAM-dependent methyltransferase